MKKLIILICMLACIACQQQSTDYSFAISGFTKEEELLVQGCVQEWDTELNIVAISSNLIVREEIVADVDFIPGGYTFISDDGSVKTQISPKLKGEDLCTMVKHEIGHFIAYYNGKDWWKWHLKSNNTMAPDLKNMSKSITDDDLAYAF